MMKRILLLTMGVAGFAFLGNSQCTPVFDNCPGTIFSGTDVGTCNATVFYDAPSFTGCPTGILTQTAGLGSGASYPTGTTTNTFEVFDVGTIYMNEDFSDNSAGWTLDTEWQIGPATLSSCPQGNDPATDHTPTADNGVAGVQIGGCANTTVHPTYYLTSPVINTAGAPTLQLEFYRWLTSDYTPYMQNFVEVFDGTTWQVVWQSGAFPGVVDTDWTQQTFDISAYANANMQIRFGFLVGSSGVYTVGSWNIDDVIISNAPSTTGVTCSFNVEVWNTGANTACPADLTIPHNTGNACDSVQVNYTTPVNSPICFGTTTDTHVSGPVSGANMYPGSTATVTYQFVDDAPSNSILLSEDFSDNSAGWTLDTEWEIGPAVASTCPNGDDPGTDHTGTADNGVAGVVIGGCADISSTHGFYYLTSPVVDASSFTSLNLDFYRWLTSDYTPFMENRVEVWDGAAWQIIYQTAGSPGVLDNAWTNMNFDITTYANAALQVRIGFNVGSTGAYTVGQWNIDDVTIYGFGSVTKDCTFDVTVETYNGIESAAICQGSTMPFGTQTIAGAGIYTETWVGGGAGGCDSTVTLTVTELPVYFETVTDSICDGETFVFGTQNLTTAGTYTELLQSVGGCDSTVNLTLLVNPAYDIQNVVDICQGDSVEFAGAYYSTPGTYTDVTTFLSGCDSSVTMTLNVHPIYNETATAWICPEDSYQFGTQSLSSTGQYTEVFSSAWGCDSTVVLDLYVHSAPTITVVSATDEMLGNDGTINIAIAGTSTYTYLWSDGQTTQDAFGLTAGTYTVTVTDEATGCTTAETVTIGSQVGLVELLTGTFTIHPNPSNGIFNVTVTSLDDNMRMEIVNAMGQLVAAQTIENETTNVNIQGVETGTYFVRVISGNSIGVETIVIK